MAMRRLALLLAVIALLVGCAEPLPQAKSSYVGQWYSEKEKMRLEITAAGYVDYERQVDGRNTSIKAPIQEFLGDDFTVGLGPVRTRFVVSKPPKLDGGVWKMTVDGVELIRRTGPSDFNA
jgi:hypothetical protein